MISPLQHYSETTDIYEQTILQEKGKMLREISTNNCRTKWLFQNKSGVCIIFLI